MILVEPTVEFELSTDPDVVILGEWVRTRTMSTPWAFLGWTEAQYERWTHERVAPSYDPEAP